MLVIYGILEKYEILIYLVILKKGISILQQYKAVPMSVLTDFPQVLKHFRFSPSITAIAWKFPSSMEGNYSPSKVREDIFGNCVYKL